MTRAKRHHDVRRRVRHAVRVAFEIEKSPCWIGSEAADGFAATYFSDFGAMHARQRWQPGDRRYGQFVAASKRDRVPL